MVPESPRDELAFDYLFEFLGVYLASRNYKLIESWDGVDEGCKAQLAWDKPSHLRLIAQPACRVCALAARSLQKSKGTSQTCLRFRPFEWSRFFVSNTLEKTNTDYLGVDAASARRPGMNLPFEESLKVRADIHAARTLL